LTIVADIWLVIWVMSIAMTLDRIRSSTVIVAGWEITEVMIGNWLAVVHVHCSPRERYSIGIQGREG
jgi:hypothetical protein